jgi:hypothetical protein
LCFFACAGAEVPIFFSVDVGLACGVAVGVFSKPLAVLIGLLVFGLQVRTSPSSSSLLFGIFQTWTCGGAAYLVHP